MDIYPHRDDDYPRKRLFHIFYDNFLPNFAKKWRFSHFSWTYTHIGTMIIDGKGVLGVLGGFGGFLIYFNMVMHFNDFLILMLKFSEKRAF